MYLLAEIQVCYGKYGCFSTGKPFNRIVLLPFPPALISPTYRLYTKLNPDKPQFIDDSDVHKLKNCRYSGSKRTVIVVHGYIGKLKNNSTYTSKEVIDILSYYRLYCHYVLIITHPESEVWVKSEVEPASQRLLSLCAYSAEAFTHLNRNQEFSNSGSRKTFVPSRSFLINLFQKTMSCIRLKLRVWKERLHILRIFRKQNNLCVVVRLTTLL